ncbi:MAG: bifunctional 2-C-methyl-D-erythritol 4-phosphate cytidylyltransferase/2-C-methyl-D-erythritol 2,4-cyclodiphosphate synthase [Alphaproteobacteria bacterium]|nr:bifunctional 2-C-methyl-D-erythritol 4-phosphate cytidylyltransferase/2-C-methyl-D-erythritol 2,4-cyclodiphosphate synthase [Alphaproteobacteria bacterium]
MTDIAAVIVAAGRGARFGGAVPKQYQRLAGRPVLRWSLEAYSRHPRVRSVQVVIDPADTALFATAAQGLALRPPVAGGSTRQESVRRALEALASDPPHLVLIHDGARPLVAATTIDAVIDALARHQAALPALAVSDTLKRSDDGTRVAGTIPRAGLWRAQTPQGFDFATILAAHRRFAGEEMTDDAALAERAGHAVALVAGHEDNVKITTPDDLARAERVLAAIPDIRTGTGFDVHRFSAGDHVVLCGVRIAHDRGLEGHSDADVGLHALTDALLGAIGAGDIGEHFPPSDARWRGADSAAFLAHALDLVRARGARVLNVDVTLICERPKVAPHRAAMRDRLAAILSIEPDRCSVKATTTEGLGFAGRREGIAAQAVATIACMSPIPS